jgi:UDP-N-acetylglucosamine 2-epimerase (non-hydrolysing)
MKVAALFTVAIDFPDLQLRLIHTGQHYDFNMSDVFMQQLGLPEPACHLGVGSGSHAAQTAEIMKGYENWIKAQRPDMCVVVGDVNSTIACALVAAKEEIKVAHVEAGLRSFDRTMPEEINRVLTDSISDVLFVTEPSGVVNLKREGHPDSAIHMAGNTMIDTLLRMLPAARVMQACARFDLEVGSYALITLHRPSNVDDENVLRQIMEQIAWLAGKMSVLFPVHPRTQKRLQETGIEAKVKGISGVHLIEPVGYLDSLSLIHDARVAVTDSGGIQEETTALGVPCLTLRENTERPITLELGSNTLIGGNWELFRQKVEQIAASERMRQEIAIPTWDGKAGRRIMEILSHS